MVGYKICTREYSAATYAASMRHTFSDKKGNSQQKCLSLCFAHKQTKTYKHTMTKTNTHPDTPINKHTHIAFTMLLKLISLGGGEFMSAEVMKMTTKRRRSQM